MKRVLGYLDDTQNCFTFNKYSAVLEGYSDANWITRSTETKFTGGYFFTIHGGVISWKSSIQTCIAHSAIDSKIIS